MGFEQGGEIGLSAYERAFVLNNFELLASHFAGLSVRHGGPHCQIRLATMVIPSLADHDDV